MRFLTKIFVLLGTLLHVSSFVPMMMAKHSFKELTRSITVADKYFLVHSLVNHVVLRQSYLLHDLCEKKLNYTDVSNILVSLDLEYVIQKHWQNKSSLQLYETIKENAELTDCYIIVKENA